MGHCTPRIAQGLDYSLNEGDSFLICERSPIRTQKIFEIHFIFECVLSTSNSTCQQSQQREESRKYQILIKMSKCEINTALSEICKEIQQAFKMAERLNCSKVEFIEPNFETQRSVNLLFSEIIRMLFCFDQKKMFRGQSKIYLNWSAVDKKSSIANMRRQMTI